jgi:LysM repeat protein
MKRFLQQSVDVVSPLVETELSMEDFAKMNIRKTLIESALALGAIISLTEQEKPQEEDALAPYLEMLKAEEGVRTKVYKDTKGISTIGVGFNLTRSDAPEVFRQCFGDQCDDVMTRAKDPKRGMSEAEVERLTRHDLETTFLPRTRKAVEKFEEFPLEARTALVSSAYRGSLLGSPKTLALINAGKGSEAAAEYLRNREYEASKKAKTGIAPRMEREAKGIGLIGAAPVAAPKPAAPAPTTTPPAIKPANPATSDYLVQKGDSLSAIAKRTGSSIETITRENKIADPNKIGVGQRIRIPKG